jgi:hypothetical protein
VAVACGVPLYRPASPPGWKYEALEGIEGVHVLPTVSANGWGAGAPFDLGQRAPGIAARERAARLASHWDAVAAAARAGRRESPAPPALALIAGLPHQLHARETALTEQAHALAQRVREADSARARAEAAAAETIESLQLAAAKDRNEMAEAVARLSTLGEDLASAKARIAALDEVRGRKIVRLGLFLTRPLLWIGRGKGRAESTS